MRNALLDLTTIVPATAYHRRSYTERYSRYKHVVHFTPKHGSWLNQVELWFGVLARRLLKRGDLCSVNDFEARLLDYLDVYNTHYAHPAVSNSMDARGSALGPNHLNEPSIGRVPPVCG